MNKSQSIHKIITIHKNHRKITKINHQIHYITSVHTIKKTLWLTNFVAMNEIIVMNKKLILMASFLCFSFSDKE